MVGDQAKRNKFLIVRAGVLLTPIIEPVICELELWYEKYYMKVPVTSGQRAPIEQLGIIRRYAIKYGIDKEFPSILDAKLSDQIEFEGKLVFSWQPALSRLLNIGILINAPIATECLLDYWKDGKNRKGRIIPPSEHFDGTCFDMGDSDDADTNMDNEYSIALEALNSKTIKGLVSILLERKNNCIHFKCKPVV
jgi:hypothetical protein